MSLPVIEKSIDANGDEIRRYADLDIQGSIDRAVATLEPEKFIAIVVTPELTRAHGGRITGAIIVRKPGSDWSFVTVGHYDRHDYGVQGVVRWSR